MADLRERNARFARFWDARPIESRLADRKSFDHPQVGRMTLDCDSLTVPGDDQTLVLYSAAPGSPDAAALDLLRVVGVQDLTPS